MDDALKSDISKCIKMSVGCNELVVHISCLGKSVKVYFNGLEYYKGMPKTHSLLVEVIIGEKVL